MPTIPLLKTVGVWGRDRAQWWRIHLQCRRHRRWVQSLGQEDSLKWQPTPVFLPEKSLGQRNLVGYGPKGRT